MSNSPLTPVTLGDDRAVLGLVSDSRPPAAPGAESPLCNREQILGSDVSPSSDKQSAPRSGREIAPLDFRQLVTAALRERQAPAELKHIEITDERPSGPLWFSVRLTESYHPLPNRSEIFVTAGPKITPGEGAQYLLLGSLQQDAEAARFTITLIRLGTLEMVKTSYSTIDGPPWDYYSIYRGAAAALRRFGSLWL